MNYVVGETQMKKVSIFISKFEDVEHFVNVMDRLDGSVKLKYGFCTAEARSVISIAPLVGIKPLELWSLRTDPVTQNVCLSTFCVCR